MFKKLLKGRFAPSPSGRMHLGNVYSALMSYLSVKSRNGLWLLRIEDLDRQRCKKEYAIQLMDDLRWLGLVWDEGPTDNDDLSYYQSTRNDIYNEALLVLQQKGVVYNCYCRRADILAARAPHASDGIVVYGGTCRNLSRDEEERLMATRKPAKRLMVPDETTSFEDGHYGLRSCNLAHNCGDFIIQRADGNFAYQLAVVVDDALMGVNEIVRGNDLLDSTHQQIYLYKLLGYDTPAFYHLPLLMSSNGHRLSKRDQDTDMGYLRMNYTPEELIGHIMYISGITTCDIPVPLSEATSLFNWDKISHASGITVI